MQKQIYDRKFQLNAEEEQVIIGTMLGDASINKTGRYRFRQMNLKYCRFVHNKLSRLQLCRISNRQSGLVSSSHFIFKKLRLQWYNNFSKIIPTYVYKQLDLQAIAHLVMDDGGFATYSKQIRVATNCFSKKENDMLCLSINNVFGKRVAYVHWIKYKKYYRIHFKPSSTAFVNSKLKCYMPECMLYKVGGSL